MATTTNYSWTTPDDTDLVKDGAAAIRTLGSSIDTTVFANAGAAVAKTIFDAKADILTATAADTPAILAVGTNGQILSASPGEATGLKWINNPVVNWNERLAPLGASSSFQVNAIASDGTAFVAVGENGYLYESSDGTTWTSRTSGFGANDIDSVAFGTGIWVAVGQNGTISTSTDRVTWTTRTANMSTNQINYVAYINSNFVAVGAGGGTTNTGGVTYSSDGITWTRVNQSLTVGATYNSVIWNGTNFIVGGISSTNNYIYSATLAGSWTAAAAQSVTIESLFYDGTRTFYSTGTSIRYTTATDLSSTQSVQNFDIQSGDNHRQLYLYSGKLYYSEDGWISNISTTPSVAGYLAGLGTAIVQPSTQGNGTGGVANLNSCIWVGSQGIVIGGNFGQINTNF